MLKTDWKEPHMFQSMQGTGAQAKTQSIKKSLVCYKKTAYAPALMHTVIQK